MTFTGLPAAVAFSSTPVQAAMMLALDDARHDPTVHDGDACTWLVVAAMRFRGCSPEHRALCGLARAARDRCPLHGLAGARETYHRQERFQS